MKDENSVPAAQKMTDVSLLIFPVEVQKRRIQMIDDIVNHQMVAGVRFELTTFGL